MSNYYQPSGKMAPMAIPFFILTALIAMPLLALAYTYLVWYIPLIYINILITAGFGFGVGILMNFLVIHFGKVRNAKIAALFAGLGALIAMYFSWAVWIDLVINSGEYYGNSRMGITASNVKFSQLWVLVFDPIGMKNIAMEINKVGTWGFKSTAVSGPFLGIIWAIEALIVIIIPVLICPARAKKPFCEHDNKWFEENQLPAFGMIENPLEMVNALESKNTDVFKSLHLAKDSAANSHSIFTIFTSKHGENFLSIENRIATVNKKGEIEFEEHEFIEYVSVDGELLGSLAEVKHLETTEPKEED